MVDVRLVLGLALLLLQRLAFLGNRVVPTDCHDDEVVLGIVSRVTVLVMDYVALRDFLPPPLLPRLTRPQRIR